MATDLSSLETTTLTMVRKDVAQTRSDWFMHSGWVSDVRRGGKGVKVLPRVLFEGWSMHDFMEIFGDSDKMDALGGYLGNQLKVSFWREEGKGRREGRREGDGGKGRGRAGRWVAGGKTRQDCLTNYHLCSP